MKKKLDDNKWRTKYVYNNDRCWWWLASLVMAAMLAMITTACSEEVSGRQEEAETEGLPAILRIDVSAHEPAVPQTRAMDTENITNLHILVYNSTGNLIGHEYAENLTTVPCSVTVNTRSAESCTVYAIANTGNATLFDGKAMTEAALKAMTTTPLTSWDGLAQETHLLMTGKLTGVKIEAGSPDNNKIGGLSVSRVAAQVTLKLTTEAEDNIIIHNYRVYGLPAQAYYIVRPTSTESNKDDTGNIAAGDDAVNPATPDDWISSPPVEVETANKDVTFYMYENRCGVNAAITNQTDKIKVNAPDSAAYVLINGETNGYKYTWRVYLGANNTNNFNMKRNCTYTYNIKLKHGGATDTRITITNMFEELAGGNANCYMVVPGASVDIPVERANESWIKIDGSVENPDTKTYYQLFYNTEWYAELVWEDVKGLIALSDKTGTGATGKFKVTTATTPGNAVVAVKRKSDNAILWSWHIWVTNDVPTVTLGGYKFMDRNLGAYSNAYDAKASACGLIYQWGRKDPFPGTAQSQAWTNAEPTVYGTKFSATNIPSDSNINLMNAIQNPTVFYMNGKNGDWYLPTYSAKPHNNNLWANTKSVFDPCPTGWRVPPIAAFSGFSSASNATYGYRWGGNYWPMAGGRSLNGSLYCVAEYMHCWSVSAATEYQKYELWASIANGIRPKNVGEHSRGMSIRCIAE